MNITSLNSAANRSESTKAAVADRSNQQAPVAKEEPSNMFNRFDRYEGRSVYSCTFELNDNSNSVPKGIFSENTSDKVVKKFLKWQEEKDGCAPEGFSAKHIISAFFQAESEARYNCGVNYEHLTKAGKSNQDTINSEVCNGNFTEDNVALIASQIGKYIDSLYGQGKYTDEEYAQLNDEIKKCSKHWLNRITDAKVGKRLREEDARLYSRRYYVKIPIKTRAERRLEALSMRKKIEAENPFDINVFFAKVEQMRFNVAGIEKKSNVTNSTETSSET